MPTTLKDWVHSPHFYLLHVTCVIHATSFFFSPCTVQGSTRKVIAVPTHNRPLVSTGGLRAFTLEHFLAFGASFPATAASTWTKTLAYFPYTIRRQGQESWPGISRRTPLHKVLSSSLQSPHNALLLNRINPSLLQPSPLQVCWTTTTIISQAICTWAMLIRDIGKCSLTHLKVTWRLGRLMLFL